jgi:hypothetical protein
VTARLEGGRPLAAVVRDVNDNGAVVDLNPDARLAGGRVA